MNTVLLTLGRLPKSLDIARAFAGAGWRVIVAEPFRRHLAGASRSVARSVQVTAPSVSRARYLDDLAQVVAEEGVSLVVPVSEETIHVAHLAELLPASVPVFTMPPDIVLALHDKLRFIGVARRFGLAAPDSCALDDPAARALADQGHVVVKPLFSCSGRGVRVVSPGERLPAQTSGDPALVQAFVPGIVHSSCTIAQQGRAVATAIYRGALMSGSVAVAFERVEHPGIAAWVERFVRGCGYTGFISFDFVVDAAGRPWGIECNPRACSGLHFFKPQDMVAAILDPAAQVAGWRPETRLQQFYASLTETQAAMFRGGFAAHLRSLLGTPDVTWDAADPWPFLSMTYTSWPIIALSIRRRARFGEVATLDVGWYAG